MIPALFTIAPLAIAVAAILLGWFMSLERRGRRVTVMMFVWAVLAVDAAMYPGFDDPAGLLHPTFGSFSFRLPEILITMALLARLLASGSPRTIGLPMLAWVAFAGWYATAGVVGLLSGHPVEIVAFEAKAIVYLVGGIALAAGVPLRDYVARDGLPRLLPWMSGLAASFLVLDQLGVSQDVAIPLVPLQRFGEMDTDASSIFAVFGIIAVMLGAAGPRGSSRSLLVAAPLLLAPFATEQRAALLGVAVSIAAIAVCWFLAPTVRRNLSVTPTELTLLALGIVGMVLLPTIGRATVEPAEAVLPFSGEVRTAFQSPAKLQSSQSRQNQWRAATRLAGDRPVSGWGLGMHYSYFERGPDQFWRSNITHNVPLDVWLRSGLVGVVLLAAGLAASASGVVPLLRRAHDPFRVALAVACAAAASGLLAKAMVESIFEKYLLVTTLGLLLGTLRATVTSGPAPVGRSASEFRPPQEKVDVWS